MRVAILAFVEDESGATAIEYGLMASLIALGALAAFTLMGSNFNALFDTMSTLVIAALNSTGGGAPP